MVWCQAKSSKDISYHLFIRIYSKQENYIMNAVVAGRGEKERKSDLEDETENDF